MNSQLHTLQRGGRRPASLLGTIILALVVLGACAGGPAGTAGPAGSTSTAPSGAPTGPSASAGSTTGVPVIGSAPCLSATNPGQPCGTAGTGSTQPVAPPSAVPTLPPPSPAPTPRPLPSKSPAPTRPAPTSTPAATPTPSAAPIVVTTADNGSTLHLAVGERFQLELGQGATWTVTVADPKIVARVAGTGTGTVSQGIYEARAAGTTTVSAIGSPPCPSGSLCPLYRIAFRITIVVR